MAVASIATPLKGIEQYPETKAIMSEFNIC